MNSRCGIKAVHLWLTYTSGCERKTRAQWRAFQEAWATMAQLSPLASTDSPPPSRTSSNGATRDRGSASPVSSRKKRRMHDPDSSGDDDLSPTSLAKRFMSDAAHCAASSSPATTPSTDVASSFELIDVNEVRFESFTLRDACARAQLSRLLRLSLII